MKNLILIAVISLFMFSCGNSNVDLKSTNTNKEKVEKVSKTSLEYANPAYMAGSDFLSFFKSLRKTGNIDYLMSFTSKETIDSLGYDKVKDFYENSFTNMSNSKLNGISSLNDSTYLMHYTNSEFATKRAFDIKVIVENDTAKIILDNLTSKYPFK
jgi:hypothetical protein